VSDDFNRTEPPDQLQGSDTPRVGVDEWVASVGGRREQKTGVRGSLHQFWGTLPPAARLGIFVIPAAFLPLVMNTGDLARYGIYTLVYATLALGLNVTVGYAGLLDLGYIAFFGFGAYTYGILASGQFHNHWHAELALPVAVIATALLGLLVGLPSRRLSGDYLAIVTLFFGQAFVVFVNNANSVNFCAIWGADCKTDLTGGANGVTNIDPLNLFGYVINTTTERFYFLLATFVIALTAVYLGNKSRTGRALRALNDDTLAAETMGIPVNRLKLIAFASGAAIAGFTGAIYGSIQTGAFPGDYDIGLLITIYAVMILGGTGSLAGAALGAIVINCVPELLRSTTNSRWIFYGIILVAILSIRPWRRCGAFLAGLVGFGFAIHAIADAAWPRLTAAHAHNIDSGWLKDVIESSVLLPSNAVQIANFAYVLLIAALLLCTRLKGNQRLVALVPTIYLAAFVWENLLIDHAVGATRLILLGALLVGLMNARPQGLLGTPRVERV
jgi:ABC-type branched-subunit amino acid transport system permease subunit